MTDGPAGFKKDGRHSTKRTQKMKVAGTWNTATIVTERWDMKWERRKKILRDKGQWSQVLLAIWIRVVAEKCSLIHISFGGCVIESCCISTRSYLHETLCSFDDDVKFACRRKILLDRREVAGTWQYCLLYLKRLCLNDGNNENISRVAHFQSTLHPTGKVVRGYIGLEMPHWEHMSRKAGQARPTVAHRVLVL